MSSSDAESDPGSIFLHTRDLSRIEIGDPIIVDYRSNRGIQERKQKTGEVTYVKSLGEGACRVWFYDADSERKIQVTLRETLAESAVKSQKTDSWTTVGTPVQVLSSVTSDSKEAVEQELVMGKRNGDFDVVVATAEIREQKHIIQWFAENNYLPTR